MLVSDTYKDRMSYVFFYILVKDVELKRIKDAFKRSSSFGGYMPDNMFAREVLGDGVPLSIAQVILNHKLKIRTLSFGLN